LKRPLFGFAMIVSSLKLGGRRNPSRRRRR
jgi:hypothetical protein